MAADNSSLIISVSAFGFGDSVVINGQQYAQEAPAPSVIIEDPHQKLFLYGERALHERTGAGLGLTDDAQCNTMVALLWQQLKYCPDLTHKQAAADRICKHVIQLICDLKPILTAESDKKLSAIAPLLNRSDLRAKAQIVLLIPDNFTEVEQQCLLNAFFGYNLRLLWRSVAALIGSLTTSSTNALLKLVRGNRIYSTRPNSSTDIRTLVHVLYLGADSIDLSSYELKFEQGSNYLIPVRLQAVYKDCALGFNYLHFAISAAHYYARQITDNMFEITRSGKGEQVEQSIFQQLLNQTPNIWGIEQDLKQTVLKVAVGDLTKWVQLPNFKNNVRLNQTLSGLDIQGFYQSSGFSPQLPSTQAGSSAPQAYNTARSSNRIMQPGIKSSSYGALQPKYATQTNNKQSKELSFIEQVSSAILNKLAQSANTTYCLIVGSDQLISGNAVFAEIKQRLERGNSALKFQVIPAMSLSHGGMIFQDRLNKNLSTYLDRLPKLSTIVTNEAQDEYQEKVLIEEKETEPQEEIKSTLTLKISRGANWIDLYISADPKFNQEAINKATDTSFKEQGISVKKAELAFNAGTKAKADEPVTVSVMQKPLSGYVKIKIMPQGESQVLPPYGVTRAFDPVKTPDYDDLIDRLARAYPPLPEPKKTQWLPSGITLRKITERNTIFSSSNKSSTLVYYNGKFSTGFQEKIRLQLSVDRDQYYPHLKELTKLTEKWNKVARSNQLKVLKTFSDLIDELLPITWAGSADWPDISELAPMIQPMLYKALQTDIRRAHKLLRQYCTFVIDRPDDVLACGEFFVTLKRHVPLNYYHMAALKVLLENHPCCFNPSSSEFCMTYEFVRLLTDSSQAILKASFEEVTAPNMIKLKTVTGTKKLSISLVILMYSLMYRCKDRNYLATPQELAEIERLLRQVEAHYILVVSEICRTCLDNAFNYRVIDFVENKLKKLIPQVIEYLKKKGTNSNIMAEINDLDVESRKD